MRDLIGSLTDKQRIMALEGHVISLETELVEVRKERDKLRIRAIVAETELTVRKASVPANTRARTSPARQPFFRRFIPQPAWRSMP